MLAVALGAPLGAQEKTGIHPLARTGVLNNAQTQFEQIFQFVFDGAKIKLERGGWGEAPKTAAKPAPGVMAGASPIEQIFNQIRSNAGQVTSAGSTSSTRYRELHFSGANLSGRIRVSAGFPPSSGRARRVRPRRAAAKGKSISRGEWSCPRTSAR